MNDGSPADAQRDPILLRLELYLNGETVEKSKVRVSRFAHKDPNPGAELDDDELAELACRIYESRRHRARYISSSLLGEPVWDMLLALYCFSSRGLRMSVTSLCYASGVPQTTALRWVGVMEERELVVRSRDRKDGRRHYLVLADKGREVMQAYLRQTHGVMSKEVAG
jgi:DNA-binding MarR family transcriptional regulator